MRCALIAFAARPNPVELCNAKRQNKNQNKQSSTLFWHLNGTKFINKNARYKILIWRRLFVIRELAVALLAGPSTIFIDKYTEKRAERR